MKVICNIKFFIYNKEFLILLVCFNKVGKGLCIKMMVIINNRKINYVYFKLKCLMINFKNDLDCI